MEGFNIVKKAPSEFDIPEGDLSKYTSTEEDVIEIKSEKYSEENRPELFFIREAFGELVEHINWGKNTSKNNKEQGGILIGIVFKNKSKKNICGIVHHIIKTIQDGDATYIQFTHNDWIQMYREFDEKYSNTKNDEAKYRVIGWYHTHPNMPVNISDIDKNTHISFFPNNWQFSVIINPQKEIWAVYNGRECKNCNGVIYADINLIKLINVEKELSGNVEEELHNNEINSFELLDCKVLENTDSFMIKRNPFFQKTQIVKKQAHGTYTNYTSQSVSHNYNNTRKEIINQYKGCSQRLSGILYYFPYHMSNNQKNYIISEDMVKKFINIIDEWNFTKNERVSFVYNLCSEYYTQNNEGIKYHRLICYTNEFFAGHLICAKNDSEFINCGKDFFYPRHNHTSVVVEFSNSLESYPTLCERYSSYDCILWINAWDASEFLFFNIVKQKLCNLRSTEDFKINKSQLTMNAIKKNIITGEELVGNILPQLIDSIQSLIISNSKSNDVLKMNKKLIIAIIKLINKYVRFNEIYTTIISYKIPDRIDRGFVSLHLDNFCELRFWIGNINNGLASFKNLDDGIRQSKLPRFALVLSNRDVDEVALNSFKKKLGIAHTVAFCFNTETGNYMFYRL